ncbi:cytochrome P450 [Cadophora sp. DSE1049]|nr:cytochrome P450 [Cadophora sp. DSE1049]
MSVVVITSAQRSAIYSSRHYFPHIFGILSGESRIVLMPYGDRWRKIRKVMHSILNKTNMPKFAPYQDIESRHLLYDYLHHPDRWFASNQRFANSVIMSVTFGKMLVLDDPNVAELFETSNEFLEALQPGASPIDTFYFLEWLPKPLQWWRPRAERYFQKTVNVYRREVERLEAKIADGTARDCFAVEFLASPEVRKFGETQFLFTLGTIMEGGSDTSRITISQVIAAAALDKRWVNTAREQLDAVCGGNSQRLRQFSDRANLPYITAAIGMPHALTQDDEFEGYKFRAGTVFTWNVTSIALDLNEYEDPLRFWPDRFLNDDLNDVQKGHWSFEPGRRSCPGYNVGETNIWIVIARLLYCFDFEQYEDQPIDSFQVNWLEHAAPSLPVKITIRSEQHRELVKREGKLAVDIVY